MNKKRALFVSVIAFFMLVHPLSRLMSFTDEIVCLVIAHAGCVNPPWSLLSELVVVLFNHFGARTAQLVLLVFPFAVALIPAVLIYRYLRRRDFDGVCADCVAHPMMSWTLLVVFAVFSVFGPTIRASGVTAIDVEPMEQEEMSENEDPVRLELCLCHPDTEELTKPLMSGCTVVTQLLSTAQSVEGYRLMTSERDGEIDDVVYVRESPELTEADIESASVMKDEFCGYQVLGKLNPNAGRRFAELTRAYMPHGKKNPRDLGYRLAIVVNGRLLMAPTIQTEIAGEFMISGRFSREEALKLAASLNRGCK